MLSSIRFNVCELYEPVHYTEDSLASGCKTLANTQKSAKRVCFSAERSERRRARIRVQKTGCAKKMLAAKVKPNFARNTRRFTLSAVFKTLRSAPQVPSHCAWGRSSR